MQRIMAIDYGDARTGVAVSDALGFGVGQAETIRGYNEDTVVAQILTYVRSWSVAELEVGCPKNMDGTYGERAEKSRLLAERLRQETGLPVSLWDERRTTVDAHRILSEGGKRSKKHRPVVDAVAASLILEGYLSYRSYHSGI